MRLGKGSPNSGLRGFLTFSEVQFYLGVKSRKTMLKYIKSGALPAFKLGGTRWRISQSDVVRFLNRHRSSQISRRLPFAEVSP